MKKQDKWKENNWDKWTFWRKVLHVIAVTASLLIVISVLLGSAYVLLIGFGIYGFLLHIRDAILLGIGHLIFG